jgi:uncharacterized protein YndB with AHSA1/START domain
MTHLRITQQYDAPIERVFDLLTDFAHYPEWNVTYIEIPKVEGPPRDVGTRIYSVIRLLGRTMDGWAEIVEIEPPRLLRTTGTSTQGGKLDYTLRLTPIGIGTQVILEVEYELPAGIFGKVADKLFIERAVERDLHHSMDNFKAFVETKQPLLV